MSHTVELGGGIRGLAAGFQLAEQVTVPGGRQGLYTYVDMDIASEMGLSMADHFISGRTKREAIGHVPYGDRTSA